MGRERLRTSPVSSTETDNLTHDVKDTTREMTGKHEDGFAN